MKPTFKLLPLLTFLIVSISVRGQWWTTGNTAAAGDYLGTTNTQPLEIKTTNTGTPQPINIYTGNTIRSRFTVGNTFGAGSTAGDGLRFFDPSGGIGNLDLWTSSSQQTHIRWDGGRLNTEWMNGDLDGWRGCGNYY